MRFKRKRNNFRFAVCFRVKNIYCRVVRELWRGKAPDIGPGAGIEEHNFSPRKLVFAGWSFIFILFSAYLFTGWTPADFWRQSFGALGGETKTISLYASLCFSEAAGDDYRSGWWGSEKAQGAPEAGPRDDLLFFSDRNSAFYNGGNRGFVCGRFEPLRMGAPETAAGEKAPEGEDGTEIPPASGQETYGGPASAGGKEAETAAGNGEEPVTDADDDSDADIAAEIGAIGNDGTTGPVLPPDGAGREDGAVSGSDPIMPDDGDAVTRTGEGPAIIENGGMGDSGEVEIVPSGEEGEVEVIGGPLADDAAAAESETSSEALPESGEPVSFWRGLDEKLNTHSVRAQEYVAAEVNQLSDLGEFKSATIMFSLGMGTLRGGDDTGRADDGIREYQPENDESSDTDNGGQASAEVGIIDTVGDAADGMDDPAARSDGNGDAGGGMAGTDAKDGMIPAEDGGDGSGSEIITAEDQAAGEAEVMNEEEAAGPVGLLHEFIRSARAREGEARIIVWYSLGGAEGAGEEGDGAASSTGDDRLWQKLDTLDGDGLSNALNGGYFDYEAPFLSGWEDINSLSVKFEGVVGNDVLFSAYLDSVWVEAEYEKETELDKLKKRQRWEEALDLLSSRLVFGLNEGGEMEFRYNKNEERLWDNLKEIMGWGDFWQDVKLEAELVNSRGETVNMPLTLIFDEDGEFSVKLPDDIRGILPGKYTVRFHIEDSSGGEPEIFDLAQDFSWGVMAMNFNKSMYAPGETAYIQMAVLDNIGHTVCDASVELRITNYELRTNETLTITNGGIKTSGQCGPETVTDEPDYYAHYEFSGTGEYEFVLTIEAADGEKSISEKINVTDEQMPFTIERAGPTRIWPKADYGMRLLVSAREDFKGDIVEFVPLGFKITNYELRITNSDGHDPFSGDYGYSEEIGDSGEKKLIWRGVELSAGDELEIKYTFDAPDRSPELYLVGPLSLENSKFEIRNSKFDEARRWQIASDAVRKRARTVIFPAGVYNGGGAAGNNTNTDYSFSAFQFRLAETGVDIRSAFLIFESQFEAYTNTNGNYTGYKLAFDSCSGSGCGPSAFSGFVHDDSTTLAYTEGESNQARLLADVTSEPQLSSYTGGGQVMEGQAGYHIKLGSSINSIANAKAILVLTYAYDADSPDITNTVAYPLDSTSGTDWGSRQASIGTCTRNNNCPLFYYKMEVPEFPAFASSTYRLAQWYRLGTLNDGNGTTDIDTSLDIQTYDVLSSSFHHESANGGTQGNMAGMYFPAWTNSGFAENADQLLEYSATAGTNFLVGGEVFETYIASSSAATSTRTVSFPLGVVANGRSAAQSEKTVTVYFPENGSATGTVRVKSAWLRIMSNDAVTGANNFQVSTKVGANATSSALTYTYDTGATVVKSSFDFIHIISTTTTDYAVMEEANKTSGVPVKVVVLPNNASAGVISAELLITYTYTSEDDGYLTSLELFAGQMDGAATTSATSSLSAAVAPEYGGKTMRAGAMLSGYTVSATDGNMGAGAVFGLDANISTGIPACTRSRSGTGDSNAGNNYFFEYYEDVTANLSVTDGAAYAVCYRSDETLVANDRARMGGRMIYTYQWENEPPTGVFITASTTQKIDGSGAVDIGVEIYDVNLHDCRAKIEFATGTTCVFSPPGDPALDETDANITADFGDPYVENDNTYQVGTPDGYISTASGSNSVFFDWFAEQSLGEVEGDYCLRLTANDLALDQTIPATTTVYIDTIDPTAPGTLELSSRTGATTTLTFGATSTETNFREYVIYYKQYDGTDPDEGDLKHASTSDMNLFDQELNEAATTSIGNLAASTTYSFAIWAYDDYGNAASSSRVDITTNDAPTGAFNAAAQKDDGSGIVELSLEVADANQHNCVAKLEYTLGGDCDFASASSTTLDAGSIAADWGSPTIDNGNEYQIGTSANPIITPVSNTVTFDWFGKTDEPDADATYCLRLTVNDGFDDQLVSATATLTLDNVNPSAPGAMSTGDVTTASVRLVFGTATSSDTNEPTTDAYRIFYRKGSGGLIDQAGGGIVEHDDANLDDYEYNGATSTLVSGLDVDSWYYFNIWAYDAFGNKATSTEIFTKTNSTLSNDSLTFTNAQADGPYDNIAIAGTSTEWNFRAVITETNGWYAIASTTLRLSDNADSVSPFDDLKFFWNQTTDTFSEIGADTLGAATLSANSTSTCAVNTCTLDFKIIFNKTFSTASTTYAAEVQSGNDSGNIDLDTYNDIYQVRFPWVEQIHYRWRNDDGGE